MDNLPVLNGSMQPEVLPVQYQPPMTPRELRIRINMIQEAMREVMIEGTHYGKVPGCGDKDTLLKPGAEILCSMFRFAPALSVQREDLQNGHREYTITCTIKDPYGHVLGQGIGSCSTLESKYRWRKGERKCPHCGKESIIKGQAQYGGGWLCYGKKGGCGAKFPEGDSSIEGQHTGRAENPDIADQYNTVLKMAKKRALVDATLTATAASDIFTQDVEDLPEDSITVVAVRSEHVKTADDLNATILKKTKSEPTKPELTLPERLAFLATALGKRGVTLSQIEQWKGGPMDIFTEEDCEALKEILVQLKGGKKQPEDFFGELIK